jgi:hypothetical protein
MTGGGKWLGKIDVDRWMGMVQNRRGYFLIGIVGAGVQLGSLGTAAYCASPGWL